MDYKDPQSNRRLYILAGFLAVILLVYLGVLFDTQVNHYDDYLTQSVRSIAKPEKVEASRGIITDRSGRTLVSNRSTYALTFDAGLLKESDDENEAILRLVQLCQENGVVWNDNLPITRKAPFSYTIDQQTDIQKKRFLTYLQSLREVKTALGAYLLDHPEVVSADLSELLPDGEEHDEKALKKAANALAEKLTAETLTTGLLRSAGISVPKLLEIMKEDLDIPASFSLDETRLVLGVQYELSLRKLMDIDTYVLADDVDTAFISLLSDGNYAGSKITSSTVREYETSYGAHILGTVGRLYKEDYAELKDQGYDMDDWIGRDGVELAFEKYLKGTDGRRVVSTNSDGKVTGEYYSIEPQPGSTVELTIDLKLQQATEDALAATVSQMNDKDGDTARGAGAAVVKVGTGEVLALASYPTFDLSTYRQEFNSLSAAEGAPLFNRATNGTYPPGSTFKPLIAVAALEEGKVTLTEKIRDTGYWLYPDYVEGTKRWGWWCWNHSGHGRLNITEAITASCNYFFYQMGYLLGIDTIDQYALDFGLGKKTGIEIGDEAGTLASPETREKAGGVWYGGDTVQAAIGQSDNLFTPLQLANYIATLVSGGKHYDAHLLKAVKSYDNSQVIAVGAAEPSNTIDISDSTLNAVKKGMYDYTQPGGMVYSYFKDCVVSAGAKTGTAQLGANITNNGVFVCFAPYEEPEIAVAIAIEHGGSGAALASTAVEILNAYFTPDEIGTAVISENQLLQ
ncbi:penicillin-binding transpeptidase domain-containing protein [uncultured Dysosmobacter sp.]|uniref:penicillin-binding transpeptidase domain-containing protein n=1 Tax=uncultured Dysosmobacter sp. TaxID=2591384 RepID=UPI002633ED0E|nr:penicillin-binding transpeptidase domain-containing protein [uncultured Dysosmobacter sp.]